MFKNLLAKFKSLFSKKDVLSIRITEKENERCLTVYVTCEGFHEGAFSYTVFKEPCGDNYRKDMTIVISDYVQRLVRNHFKKIMQEKPATESEPRETVFE